MQAYTVCLEFEDTFLKVSSLEREKERKRECPCGYCFNREREGGGGPNLGSCDTVADMPGSGS